MRLSVRGVTFAYRAGAVVLEVPELEVGPGLTLVTGPNGAGKTTLLRLLAGVERPDAGTISVGGRDLWVEEVEARRVLSYVPEQPDVTPYATVAEVVGLVARLRRHGREERDRVLETAGLAALGGRTIRELSFGQRRRVLLGAAMIGAPQVLLLDEPLESLDRGMAEKVLAWITSAVGREATVLVSTHGTTPFEALAKDHIRLEAGRIVP